MAGAFAKDFDHIVAVFQTVVEDVAIIRYEEDPQRAILLLKGLYRNHQIYLREVLRSDGSRKYSYYVIREEKIIAEFDNASDPRALRLKYGDKYAQHRLEEIPHFHSKDKQSIELTDEMDCEKFIRWLEQNL